VACNGGTQTRECADPQHGGNDCEGPSSQVCNVLPCCHDIRKDCERITVGTKACDRSKVARKCALSCGKCYGPKDGGEVKEVEKGKFMEGRPRAAGEITTWMVENCKDDMGARKCNRLMAKVDGFCDRKRAAKKCAKSCQKKAGCGCMDGPYHLKKAEKVITTLHCLRKLRTFPTMCTKNGKPAKNMWAAMCPFTCGRCQPALDTFGCGSDEDEQKCQNKKQRWANMCDRASGAWRIKCPKTCGDCE